MRRAVVPLIGLLGASALVIACYGPVLFSGRQFGYRDAATYYYPLYLRVQQEWNAGRIPLWEPEENGGVPLLGNPTAAVLYPGKLLYAVFPYAWSTRLYIVVHTFLALAGMMILIRSWGISGAGSLIGGLSYAFGAPVLFQYCNVIYLIGAAWMPWSFHGTDRWVRLGSRWGLVELACALTMQILAGDPQAAYMALACAGGYAVGIALVRVRGTVRPRMLWIAILGIGCAWCLIVLVAALVYHDLPASSDGSSSWKGIAQSAWMLAILVLVGSVFWAGRRRTEIVTLRPMLLGLALAAGLAAAMSGAQLVPTVEYSRQTFRALDRSPVENYAYSVPPYRLAELIWPNVSGRAHPENRTWISTLEPLRPHDYWSPSLYLGAFTLVLAVGAIGVSGGPPWRAWLSGVLLVSLLASLGLYTSPLWLARGIPALRPIFGGYDPPFGSVFRPDGFPRDGDGSFYWLLSTVLPGFSTFRYPSKFLTLTALALSGLAGAGWDQLASRGSRRVVRTSVILFGLGLLAVGASYAWQSAILAFWARRAYSAVTSIGPLNPEGALTDFRRALVHGGVMLAAAILLARWAHRRAGLAGIAAVVVVTADLALANAQLVWTVPQSDFERIPAADRLIAESERLHPSPGPFRVHRLPNWTPHAWIGAGSPQRLREVLAWQRDTSQPLTALPAHLNYTMTMGALELYDYLWFFRPLMLPVDAGNSALLQKPPGERFLYAPRRGFDLWGTRYYVLPVRSNGWTDENRAYAAFLNDTERIYPDVSQFDGDAKRDKVERYGEEQDWQLFRSKTAYPRAWVVHEARIIKPIIGLEPSERDHRCACCSSRTTCSGMTQACPCSTQRNPH
jgi:hypothetical protein